MDYAPDRLADQDARRAHHEEHDGENPEIHNVVFWTVPFIVGNQQTASDDDGNRHQCGLVHWLGLLTAPYARARAGTGMCGRLSCQGVKDWAIRGVVPSTLG